MELTASLNYLHIAPRKVRLVAGLIRGLDTHRAELELRHLPKRSSLPLLKLLQSAIANAKHNFQLSSENLYIKEIRVDQGTMQKRFRARAFGRAAPIRRKTSHISLVLATRDDSAPVKKMKKEKPVVRDIRAEDLQEDFEGKSHDEKDNNDTSRPSPRGFARRVFQRKAI